MSDSLEKPTSEFPTLKNWHIAVKLHLGIIRPIYYKDFFNIMSFFYRMYTNYPSKVRIYLV